MCFFVCLVGWLGFAVVVVVVFCFACLFPCVLPVAAIGKVHDAGGIASPVSGCERLACSLTSQSSCWHIKHFSMLHLKFPVTFQVEYAVS